ncbi:small subunit processome component 20-like protein [Huso huso]|uniref:Small subunit processome component 20-like protein n=1 Tax=Huso huso TaxID=61971 RepID=A0ABR0ZT10_HUSHU
MSVLDHFLSLIQVQNGQTFTDLSHPWAALVVLPHIRPMDMEKVMPHLMSLIDKLLNAIDNRTLGRGISPWSPHLFCWQTCTTPDWH